MHQGFRLLATGIILFLFGMMKLSAKMQGLFTARIRSYIKYTVRKPLYGLLTGMISTIILQSSSAKTILIIGKYRHHGNRPGRRFLRYKRQEKRRRSLSFQISRWSSQPDIFAFFPCSVAPLIEQRGTADCPGSLPLQSSLVQA